MINEFKGKRFMLFVLIFVIAGIQAIQPMLPQEWSGIILGVLAFLGALKTFFPYQEDKSGTINLEK